MKQHGYLSKSALPAKRFHSSKLWSCTACPPCQAAGSRRISAARESPKRGLEQGSASLWAFQRAVRQLQRIEWALNALLPHVFGKVLGASDSALTGVVGLRMAATIACAMTCNYMVHPRLECGPVLGRNPRWWRSQAQAPGRLTPAKLHIAPHLRPKDAHSRLAPSHSQKASSFSRNCLRNCIRSICYCHNRNWLPPFCFKKVSPHGPLGWSWR